MQDLKHNSSNIYESLSYNNSLEFNLSINSVCCQKHFTCLLISDVSNDFSPITV